MKLALALLIPLAAATPVPGGVRLGWGRGVPDGTSASASAEAEQGPMANTTSTALKEPSANSTQVAQANATLSAVSSASAAPGRRVSATAGKVIRPSVYENATDWWVPFTVYYGKWADGGKWDGNDNTQGVTMYIDDMGRAHTSYADEA